MGEVTLVHVLYSALRLISCCCHGEYYKLETLVKLFNSFFHDVAAPMMAASSQSRTKLDKGFLGQEKVIWTRLI